jgi:flagellar biosynthesis protein FlhF
MTLKSYYTKDVKSALALARQELGAEAMLVHSRKAPPEARHLGECEVVFAVDAPLPEGAAAPAAIPAQAAPADGYSRLASDVAEVRKQLERMASTLSRSAMLTARNAPPPELAGLFAALLDSGLEPGLAQDILYQIRASGTSLNEAELRAAAGRELGARFKVDPELGAGDGARKIVALVGPCGAGKTATLVKMAVLHGVAAGRPTRIVSLDTRRVAASEQLGRYAAILGVPFAALETVDSLRETLSEDRDRGLVLIDTPGHPLKELDRAEELAGFLSGRPDIDTHLVLTASMKSADVSRVVDHFEMFKPRKLLFTKLDETGAFGPVVNEAARTGKAVSFLCWGQQIPEDIEPATKERIVELVLDGVCVKSAGQAA